MGISETLKKYIAEHPTDRTGLKAAKIRGQRDELLAETDVMMLPDYPLTTEKREAIIEYRQTLRDITNQPGFPDVELPKKPF